MVAMDAMDTSPSSPVWAQDVDVFTSPDRYTTEAARQKGLGAIVAMLNAGELQFLDLLRSMESCLVTTDDARRARGVLLLAEAVTQYGVSPAGAPKRAMPKPAAELLASIQLTAMVSCWCSDLTTWLSPSTNFIHRTCAHAA